MSIYPKDDVKQRERRKKLDGYRCKFCNSPENIEAHHRIYGFEKAKCYTSLQDLVTLCLECHRIITDIRRKRRYENKEIKAVPKKQNDLTPVVGAKHEQTNFIQDSGTIG